MSVSPWWRSRRSRNWQSCQAFVQTKEPILCNLRMTYLLFLERLKSMSLVWKESLVLSLLFYLFWILYFHLYFHLYFPSMPQCSKRLQGGWSIQASCPPDVGGSRTWWRKSSHPLPDWKERSVTQDLGQGTCEVLFICQVHQITCLFYLLSLSSTQRTQPESSIKLINKGLAKSQLDLWKQPGTFGTSSARFFSSDHFGGSWNYLTNARWKGQMPRIDFCVIHQKFHHIWQKVTSSQDSSWDIKQWLKGGLWPLFIKVYQMFIAW